MTTQSISIVFIIARQPEDCFEHFHRCWPSSFGLLSWVNRPFSRIKYSPPFPFSLDRLWGYRYLIIALPEQFAVHNLCTLSTRCTLIQKLESIHPKPKRKTISKKCACVRHAFNGKHAKIRNSLAQYEFASHVLIQCQLAIL